MIDIAEKAEAGEELVETLESCITNQTQDMIVGMLGPDILEKKKASAEQAKRDAEFAENVAAPSPSRDAFEL